MLLLKIAVTNRSDMYYSDIICDFVQVSCGLYHWLFSIRHWFDGPKVMPDQDNSICEVLEAKEWERATIKYEKRQIKQEENFT